MDKSKNIENRIECKAIFFNYVKQMYFLFKHYINDMVYKNDICKNFNLIFDSNNITFDYCGTCSTKLHTVNYFIKLNLKLLLTKIMLLNKLKLKSLKNVDK